MRIIVDAKLDFYEPRGKGKVKAKIKVIKGPQLFKSGEYSVEIPNYFTNDPLLIIIGTVGGTLNQVCILDAPSEGMLEFFRRITLIIVEYLRSLGEWDRQTIKVAMFE